MWTEKPGPRMQMASPKTVLAIENPIGAPTVVESESPGIDLAGLTKRQWIADEELVGVTDQYPLGAFRRQVPEPGASR